jgi:uncharacterized membrane protein YcaP (DUF421 family)
MFLLALVYLIVLVVFGVFGYRRDGAASLPEFVLFLLLGIAVFGNVLNK